MAGVHDAVATNVSIRRWADGIIWDLSGHREPVQKGVLTAKKS
jgi:hypothetical protein